MRNLIKKIPVLGPFAVRVYRMISAESHRAREFPGSKEYWETRYQQGGNSGVGSYGNFAEFKAEILNNFVATNGVESVIELGCGDGHQLSLAQYPIYLGLDVSANAIARCKSLFKEDNTKNFLLLSEYLDQSAELVLSLDVIYHLIEDEIFEAYMLRLFSASEKYVIIYASNTDDNRGYEGTHVKHRRFTDWVDQYCTSWRLIDHIPNRYPYTDDYKAGSFAEFYIYVKP